MIIHKGFTNMAQAFTKSKNVMTYARKGALSVVLLVTDGRPSFKFQTYHAVMHGSAQRGFARVKSLRTSSRVMIAQVQANRKQEVAEMLKGYVSEPWSQNYRHIPGKKKLAEAYDSYVTSELADICPKLISPSAVTECTELDGKNPSKVYPCECGKALCTQDQVCVADDHYCMPPDMVFLQGKAVGFHK